MAKKPIIALIYDFDKTLCTEDMQNYSFIPNLGMTPAEFWGETGKLSEKYHIERILSYMYMMVVECHKKNIPLTKEYLNSLGKDIVFYKGIETWFKRINEYGASLGLQVEHYIVSSGTKEIIDGCKIVDEFKAIFGCEFHYDKNGEAIWPKNSINYTAKTQYLFRIGKGVLDVTDDNGVNEKTGERRIPYSHMIYFGDGMTDIPFMLLVKNNGGHSIAIYQEGKKEKVNQLYEDGRVNFVSLADYSKGSDVEKVVQLILQKISLNNQLSRKEEHLYTKDR